MLKGPRPFGPRFKRSAPTRRYRINEYIRVREVRLIDDNGQQVGVIPTDRALAMARERGYDLIEVAPEANPPVCKLLDFGKFKYELKKREHEGKRKQVKADVKEIRMHPNIGTHDVETKIRHAREFLEEGRKVKVWVQFRGREMAHRELGHKVLDQFQQSLLDVAEPESRPVMDRTRLFLNLSPKKKN